MGNEKLINFGVNEWSGFYIAFHFSICSTCTCYQFENPENCYDNCSGNFWESDFQIAFILVNFIILKTYEDTNFREQKES